MGKFVKWSMHWKLKLLVFLISIDAKDEHKFFRFSVGRLLGCGLYLVWLLKKVFVFFLHFFAFFGLLVSQALKAFIDQNFHYNVFFFYGKVIDFFSCFVTAPQAAIWFFSTPSSSTKLTTTNEHQARLSDSTARENDHFPILEDESMKTDQEASRAVFPEDSGNKDRRGRLYDKILPSKKIIEKVESKRGDEGCIARKSYTRNSCLSQYQSWRLSPTCKKVNSFGCPCQTIKTYIPRCNDFLIKCRCAARYGRGLHGF